MQPDTVRQIAEAIVNEHILLNGRFYFLLLLLHFVGAAIAYYLGAYLQKRGETAALKADLRTVLEQLKATTATTTEVRVAIERKDWIEREWRALRRTKLEERSLAIYDLETWIEAMKEKWVHGEKTDSNPRVIERVKMLSGLYFPELEEQTSKVWRSYAELYLFLLRTGPAATNAAEDKDVDAYAKAMSQLSAGWKEHYYPTQALVREYEHAAKTLMLRITEA